MPEVLKVAPSQASPPPKVPPAHKRESGVLKVAPTQAQQPPKVPPAHEREADDALT